jgi:hypothetical protein
MHSTPLNEKGKADHPAGDQRSLVRADLGAIAERFDAADRRARRAASIPEREAAEAERREVAGDFWAAGEDLADLLLLLLRYARRHRPDALAAALAEALRPELAPLTEAVARLEEGGRR